MSRSKGFAAEAEAAQWLAAQGYEILDRNWLRKGGELDIVARKEGVIHFVEVKSGESFDPIYAFTPAKIRRVIQTAQQWLQAKRSNDPFCIDALVVRGNEMELIENITL
ncbi:MAG: YraN family protein [Campylobacterales bacterium]